MEIVMNNQANIAPKFSFAGQKAKTANLENLATAEQMLADGVDADTVWKQTGWEKGTDGQWKWEIDDSGAEFTWRAIPNERLAVDRNDFEKFYLDSEGVWSVKDILVHDELFKAYPSVADVEFVVSVDVSSGEGVYNPEKNSITIGYMTQGSKALSILLHEIQHAIQQEENFARGGTVKQRDEISIKKNTKPQRLH